MVSRKRIPSDGCSRRQIGMYAKIKGMLKNGGERKKNASKSRVKHTKISHRVVNKNSFTFSIDRFLGKKKEISW